MLIMNLQGKINKLLTAIRFKNVDIKIDTIQAYSKEREKKYFNIYKVYIKEWTTNKKSERVFKYILQDEFTSKVDLLKYLVDKYKEGEANG